MDNRTTSAVYACSGFVSGGEHMSLAVAGLSSVHDTEQQRGGLCDLSFRSRSDEIALGSVSESNTISSKAEEPAV